LAGNCTRHIFAARLKKVRRVLLNKLNFTPKARKKLVEKFGRKYTAITFALPLKNGWQKTAKDLWK